MPCLAKKYECQREEFSTDNNRDVDFSISTRELAAFIKQANIDLNNLEERILMHHLANQPVQALFSVLRVALLKQPCRTAYEIHTGKKLERLDFTELRGLGRCS